MANHFDYEHYLLKKDDTLAKNDVPATSRLKFWGPWMIIELRDDWKLNDKEWPKGSVLATNQADFMGESVSFQRCLHPPRTAPIRTSP